MSSSRSVCSGVSVLGVEQLDREDVVERREEALEIPVLDEVAGRELADGALDDVADLAADLAAHVLALEDLVAELVDDPPLLVHDVVVLEHALALQEVLLLDLLLRLLDLLGEHAGLDRLLAALLVGRAEAVEDACRSGRRRTGARGRPRRRGRSATRRGRPGGRRGRAAGCRSGATRGARCRRCTARRRRAPSPCRPRRAPRSFGSTSCEARLVVGVAGLQAQLRELALREVLGVAAELDVDAAAGHVRRDRHGAGLAGLGDDLAPRARRTRAWR